MNRFTKLAVSLAAVSAVAFPSVVAAAGYGQIEQGDIYRAKDLTTNGAFASNITAACGDTVAYRVRIHNSGPQTLTNVKVSATLNGASSTSHGSQVRLSADNNIDNMVVTANAGVNTDKATTATYVNGSTQLFNYSITPGASSVIRNLPDGILNGGINIGNIGPLTADTESVQFQVKLTCETPTTPTTPTTPKTETPKVKSVTTLPNTGAGDVLGIFAGASAAGTAAHAVIARRRR